MEEEWRYSMCEVSFTEYEEEDVKVDEEEKMRGGSRGINGNEGLVSLKRKDSKE